MSNMKRKSHYEFILSFRWLQALIYCAPAVVLLGGMYILDVGKEWWTPVLVVYAIVALGDILAFGFQALNMQMIEISDYWEKKLRNN